MQPILIFLSRCFNGLKKSICSPFETSHTGVSRLLFSSISISPKYINVSFLSLSPINCILSNLFILHSTCFSVSLCSRSKKVTISCTNQTGDAKEEIYVTTEGKNIEAGFNPKYFLDALRNIDDQEVFIDFGTSIMPCIIRPVEEGGDYIYMILPIRMKE